MPDALWERIQPLLPPRPAHPLGCHRPRVDDRRAMDAIFFVLRTGCQWNALRATGICSSSAAHRRFQEWTKAGVFEQLWALGLQEYDELQGIQWAYQAMDGAMTKAPLGGEKNRPQSHGPRQSGGRSAASWWTAVGCPWASPSPAPTGWTSSCCRRPWIASPKAARSRQRSVEQGLWLDKGYDFDEVHGQVRRNGYVPHIVPRDAERELLAEDPGLSRATLAGGAHISWMNRFRRILVRWEKKVENYTAMVHLSCAFIAFNQAGLMG